MKGACEQFDISVARVAGQEVATAQFGIDALPALGMYDSALVQGDHSAC